MVQMPQMTCGVKNNFKLFYGNQTVKKHKIDNLVEKHLHLMINFNSLIGWFLYKQDGNGIFPPPFSLPPKKKKKN